jgi:hypothetical protein
VCTHITITQVMHTCRGRCHNMMTSVTGVVETLRQGTSKGRIVGINVTGSCGWDMCGVWGMEVAVV